jgi:PAS domain S-box-containing protein
LLTLGINFFPAKRMRPEWSGIKKSVLMIPEVPPQKTAELAISKAEQRFREVFERSPAGVARVGMDGTWLEVNDKFCEMLGYSREELFDIRPSDIIYPEDRKENLEERNKLISGEAQQVSIENRYLSKDGRVIWVARTVSLVRDASGRPQYFVAVTQDITDRKQAEKKLEQATRLSSAAMAASRIAIFRWDLHTGEWEWDRTEPIVGQISAEVLRTMEGWLTRVLPEDREDLFERLNRSAKLGVDFEHEFRVMLPPDDAITWVYARGKVYRGQGGLPEVMTGAVVNMNEYRQLRRELEDNQQLLLLAKSAGGVHAWAMDVSRIRRIWWTPLSYRLYGRSEELGPPTREEFLKLVYPEDRDKVLQVYELLQKSGNDDTFSVEFRTAPTSGRVRWILSKGAIQRDAGGWPLRLVGVDIDITERREAEQALRRVEKLSALDRLATSIAHQINNPLMAASNLLYLVAESSNLNDAKQYSLLAEKELSRINHYATRILRFRRGSGPVNPQKVSAIIADILPTLGFRYPNVEVLTDFRDSRLLNGSREDLEQLFSILLENAFDAVAGAGRVRVKVVDRVQANTGEPGIKVVVADTGMGMSAEVKAHLFKPFFSTKEWTGVGLGLWIASSIVEQYRGLIKIRSSQAQAQHGTVVSVLLPLSSALSLNVASPHPKAA